MESNENSHTDYNKDGKHDLKDAAIYAELEVSNTQVSEQTWKAVLFRLARMTVGGLLILAGLAMMVLPGPGLAVLAAGLVVLSRDVVWADKALRYLRKKAPGLNEEGPIPRSTLIVSAMLMVAAIAASTWWFTGGDETIKGLF